MMLSFARYPFLITLVAWVLFPAPTYAEPTRLNVHSGPERAGYGDIASNLLMLQELRRIMPDAELRFVVSPSVRAKLKILVPEFEPGKPEQVIAGVHYLPEEGLIPPADYALGFSINGDAFHPQKFSNSAPFALVFEEYGQSRGKWLLVDQRNYISDVDKPALPELRFASGAKVGGLYIAPRKPMPPISREALFKKLGISGEQALLGFSYTALPQATVQYAQAAAQTASQLPEGKRLVLVVRDFPELDALEIPSNVQIHRLSSMSLADTEAVIAHADRPVMVTGDGSVSLALQYEKPFFYEGQTWKSRAINDLYDQMETFNGDLKKFLIRHTHLPVASIYNAVPDLAQVFNDPKFASEVEKAISQMRDRVSLPLTLKRFLPLVQKLSRSTFTDKQGLQYLLNTFLLSGQNPKLLSDLTKELRSMKNWDAFRNPVSALMVLAETSDHPEVLEQILRTLSDYPDPVVRHFLRQSVIDRMLGDADFRKVIVDRAESDDAGANRKQARSLLVDARKMPYAITVPFQYLSTEEFIKEIESPEWRRSLNLLEKVALSEEILFFPDENARAAIRRLLNSDKYSIALHASLILSRMQPAEPNGPELQRAQTLLERSVRNVNLSPKFRIQALTALKPDVLKQAAYLRGIKTGVPCRPGLEKLAESNLE